jgi:hypothetical protein
MFEFIRKWLRYTPQELFQKYDSKPDKQNELKELLIEHGNEIDVNVYKRQWTVLPLHSAVLAGDFVKMKILLQYGRANVNFKLLNGHTILYEMIRDYRFNRRLRPAKFSANYWPMMRELINHGADIHDKNDRYDQTPLDIALEFDDDRALKLMIKPEHNNITELLIASLKRNSNGALDSKCFQLLLSYHRHSWNVLLNRISEKFPTHDWTKVKLKQLASNYSREEKWSSQLIHFLPVQPRDSCCGTSRGNLYQNLAAQDFVSACKLIQHGHCKYISQKQMFKLLAAQNWNAFSFLFAQVTSWEKYRYREGYSTYRASGSESGWSYGPYVCTHQGPLQYPSDEARQMCEFYHKLRFNPELVDSKTRIEMIYRMYEPQCVDGYHLGLHNLDCI